MDRMRTKRCIPALAAAALALAPAACGAGGYSPRDKLDQSTMKFYEAYRWGELDDMREHLAPALLQQVEKEFGDGTYENVKIVDYEIVDMQLEKSKKSARVRIALQWHALDATIVNDAVFVDTWTWKTSKWILAERTVKSGVLP